MIFILALSSIFSPIKSLSFFNVIWALCIIGWFVFTFLENPTYLLLPSKHILAIYFYIFYTIIIAYLSGNGTIGNRFFELSQIPIFFMAFEKNKLLGRNNDNLFIIKLLIPFVLLTSIITLNAYRVNPYISRSLKVSQGLGVENLRKGIGGYDFIYFLVLLIPILIFVLGKTKKKTSRFVFIIMIILFSFNIVLSNFSTALLLLLLGLFMGFFVKKIKSSYFLIYLGFFVILSFTYNAFSLFFLDFMIELLGDSMGSYRLNEIKAFLLTGDEGVSIEGRTEVFQQSLNVFYQNPIFGKISSPLTKNLDGNITGFGQHSQILDTFALFGLFIGLLQIYIYFYPIKRYLKESKYVISGFSLSILLIFFTVITVNNATPSIGFAVFFIFPTVLNSLINNLHTNKNNYV
ncbi:hypothetical protein [Polaribacter gangjinensis]|nr:hypothetical protein [Polaribacter gangjinensis]